MRQVIKDATGVEPFAGPVMREIPASIGQRLVWLMGRRAEPAALNERLLWLIGGDLDPEVLSLALGGLIARHEALRTTFAGRGRALVQRVHAPRPVSLVPECPLGGLESAIEAEAAAEIAAGEWPLRARLWRLPDGRHMLMISIHQLVTDLASNALLARDLGRIHDALAAGRPLPAPVEEQYPDWCERQRSRLAGGRLSELQRVWREQLEGARFAALPHRDDADAGARLGRRAQERRDLGDTVAGALGELAQRLGTTRFVVALSAFLVHLHEHTGQCDLAVSTLFANRRGAVRETVGLFANLVVLRVRFAPEDRFEALVRAAHATVRTCERHQELPFGMLPPRTFSSDRPGQPGDVVFQYFEGEPSAAAHLRLDGLTVQALERTWRRSRFGLELFVHDGANRISAVLLYDVGRFEPRWAAAFADGYCELLCRALADAAQPVGTLRAAV